MTISLPSLSEPNSTVSYTLSGSSVHLVQAARVSPRLSLTVVARRPSHIKSVSAVPPSANMTPLPISELIRSMGHGVWGDAGVHGVEKQVFLCGVDCGLLSGSGCVCARGGPWCLPEPNGSERLSPSLPPGVTLWLEADNNR